MNAITTVASAPIDDFLNDVRAMINPDLSVSDTFVQSATDVLAHVDGIAEIDEADRAVHLKVALSTLVSGTIDVDRMDYLLRDSHYTGTLYGKYDIDVIINALTLCVGESGGPTLSIGLHRRACQAVDDFLWSRYQLFAQVLNHKTNVILNALLAEALPEAIASSSVSRIGHPRDFEEFLEFTDDLVMSSVISASLRDKNASRRMYHRALVGRDLPLYLDRIDVTEMDPVARDTAIREKVTEYESRLPAARDQIRIWPASSALIKGGGLPFVIDQDKLLGERRVLPHTVPDAYQIPRWIEQGKLPANVAHIHFFVDRQLVCTPSPLVRSEA
ncbi:MAG TPA: hypothetical protein VF158_13945 [Longimicrobiales bacterium]